MIITLQTQTNNPIQRGLITVSYHWKSPFRRAPIWVLTSMTNSGSLNDIGVLHSSSLYTSWRGHSETNWKPSWAMPSCCFSSLDEACLKATTISTHDVLMKSVFRFIDPSIHQLHEKVHITQPQFFSHSSKSCRYVKTSTSLCNVIVQKFQLIPDLHDRY